MIDDNYCYLAEDVPNITLGKTLIIDEGDGVVTKLVCLDITGWRQTQAVILTHQLYQRLLRAALLFVPHIHIISSHLEQSWSSHINNLTILTKVLQNLKHFTLDFTKILFKSSFTFSSVTSPDLL